MKKVIMGIALLFSLLITLVTLGKSTQSKSKENVIVLATHPGYFPYESVDGHGNVVGFDIDIAKAIAAILDKELEIVQADFDSLILGLSQKKYDFIMAGMSITPGRVKEISMVPYHGEDIDEVALVFWETIPEDISDFEQIACSDNTTITVQQGTWQELYLKQVPGISVRSLESNTELIMDIKFGKSRAALFEKHVAQVLQQETSELQIVSLSLPKEYCPLGEGIGIHKDNTVLVKQVKEAISHLEKTGELAELKKKWFGREIDD